MPEYSEILSNSKKALFIDVEVGKFDGKIDLKEIFAKSYYKVGIVSHKTAPSDLLALTNELFNHVPKSFLVSIKSNSFAFKDALSDNMQAIFDDLIHFCANFIKESIDESYK